LYQYEPVTFSVSSVITGDCIEDADVDNEFNNLKKIVEEKLSKVLEERNS